MIVIEQGFYLLLGIGAIYLQRTAYKKVPSELNKHLYIVMCLFTGMMFLLFTVNLFKIICGINEECK